MTRSTVHDVVKLPSPPAATANIYLLQALLNVADHAASLLQLGIIVTDHPLDLAG